MSIELEILPEVSLVDEQLEITVKGLTPNEKITLTAEQYDRFGGLWRSVTVFSADRNGTVNLSDAVPETGGYNWADPMGIVLSMKTESEPGKNIGQLLQETKPFILGVRVQRINGETVEKQVKRLWMSEGVKREEVKKEGLFGVFYIPDGKGPFPTLLVLNGSEGGMNETKAALLASHGYASLALAYSNYETLPNTIKEVPVEYFEKAISFLKAHEYVNENKLGVTGFSYGGMLALYLASCYPELGIVVACSPNCYMPGAVGADYNLPIPSFTKDLKPVPFIRYPKNAEKYFIEKGKLNAIELKELFCNAIKEASNRELDSAAIKVERINGPVLLLSGQDDCMWTSKRYCEDIEKRVLSIGNECKHVCYPESGHFIGFPYMPFPPEVMIHPTDNKKYKFGGKNRGNYEAAKGSWKAMLNFLELLLK